jgi:hypothetical protein
MRGKKVALNFPKIKKKSKKSTLFRIVGGGVLKVDKKLVSEPPGVKKPDNKYNINLLNSLIFYLRHVQYTV